MLKQRDGADANFRSDGCAQRIERMGHAFIEDDEGEQRKINEGVS